MRGGKADADVVEEKDPIEGSMVARVLPGSVTVKGGDMVMFEYQNADAPAAPERSMFVVSFDGRAVDHPACGCSIGNRRIYACGLSRPSGAFH